MRLAHPNVNDLALKKQKTSSWGNPKGILNINFIGKPNLELFQELYK